MFASSGPLTLLSKENVKNNSYVCIIAYAVFLCSFIFFASFKNGFIIVNFKIIDNKFESPKENMSFEWFYALCVWGLLPCSSHTLQVAGMAGVCCWTEHGDLDGRSEIIPTCVWVQKYQDTNLNLCVTMNYFDTHSKWMCLQFASLLDSTSY